MEWHQLMSAKEAGAVESQGDEKRSERREMRTRAAKEREEGSEEGKKNKMDQEHEACKARPSRRDYCIFSSLYPL